ncbi:PxKF domain-containing protein [Geomonas oryzae]|uniref:PxKF domain-containing protein n=1 Tax=Geomonas oryzae TaxID=2364273 RepID=UPI00100B0FCD|nr:PxKF domain-containing protein [Geomonas oryzae]
MKKMASFLPMAALLLVTAPALAGSPVCQKAQAIINPGNQTGVVPGSTVPLDGTNSNPKDNVACAWRSLDSPAMPIINQNSCFATFKAPDVGPSGQTFRFELKVTSLEAGCSSQVDTKTTNISVVNTNHPPVASAVVAGGVLPYSVNEGTLVTLDAGGSVDPDGDALSYSWVQVIDSANPVTAVTINNPEGVSATFTAPPEQYPNGETLRFRLTVSDGYLSSSTDILVQITSVNAAPSAKVSCPETVNEGDPLTLKGQDSSDPDGGVLAYQWTQLEGLPNADLSQTNLAASQIAFAAPKLSSFPYDKMTFGLTVTDNGNLTADASCQVKVKDITPPIISGAPATLVLKEATSAAGAAATFALTAHDAYYGDVDVTCDPASGSTFPLDVTTAVQCSASDLATPPNKAEASFTVKVVDTTPPELTLPGDIGPTEGDTLGGATITYADAVSALDLVDGKKSVSCLPTSGAIFPVGTTTVSCSASDAHKNQANGSFLVTVKDTTPPAVAFAGNIADGDSFYYGQTPAAPTCSANDIVSGPVACQVSGYSSFVGTHTMVATAKDNANNTGTSTRTYTVQPWTLKGFYNPVVMTSGTLNTAKGGATIPLKFEVFMGSTELTNTSSVSSVQTQSISCDSVAGTEDPVDATTTGGTALRYDTTAGQFVFNWQTPKTPGSCYAVTVTTLDGSKIVANFKLK